MATQIIISPITAYMNDTTQTTVGFFGGVLTIGFGAEEDITFTDVTTPRRLCMINLDTTNFVKYGPKSGGVMVEFGRLKPDGTPHTFDLAPSGVTLRMIADTAACKVLFWLAEL